MSNTINCAKCDRPVEGEARIKNGRIEHRACPPVLTADLDCALAELLHKRLCHHNHIDGCGWDYDTWDNTGKYNARSEYLTKARAVYDVVGRTPQGLDMVRRILAAMS